MVINTLSGDLFSDSCKCIADGGSMIDLSISDLAGHGLSSNLLDGNRNYYNFNMVNLLRQKPSVAQR